MLSSQQLRCLYRKPYETASGQELPDISRISVDCTLPVRDRLEKFLNQVGNPYLYRVDHTTVQIQFLNTPKTLQEILPNIFEKSPVSRN